MRYASSTWLFPIALLAGAAPGWAAKTTSEAGQIEFFEQHIRPVLASKCYKCHSGDAEKLKGGLLLDTRAAVLAGGDSGAAVVPGDPKNSLLIKSLRWVDKDLKMPPKEQLPDDVVADFEKWIAMGVPDPRDGPAVQAKASKPAMDIEKGRQFWAFQPPKAAPAPAVKDATWPRTDIDRFILADLEAKQLHPVADAEPRALIRRVHYDLVGLPPTPEEIERFVKAAESDRAMALAAVVDTLMKSPQFGERWGRHWLDVARYAESTGKERNFTYPEAWRYRNWVIAAVNEDKPYDQFIREQVAGDLLPAADSVERDAHVIATGFLALGPKSANEKNRELFRMDVIDEQIDVVGKAVLGVTVACARCHDHKFDPIPQHDYYALAGIFRSTQTCYGTMSAGGKNRNPSTLIALESAPVEQPQAAEDPLEQRLAMLQSKNPKKAQQLTERLKRYSPRERAELAERLGGRASMAALAKAGNKSKKGGILAVESANAPTPPAQCMGVKDATPTDAHILIRGEVDQPGELVPRGFVQVLSPKEPPAVPANASGRLQLAEWLTARDNPQTARVMVNRVWSHLFGQGLVRTADNFGATGEKPSHPALLDTLAVQFMEQGWSVKKLIRSIVLSRTYQLSTAHDPAGDEVDPDNRLLWHQSPRRLDAEAIRDSLLAVSGALDAAPMDASFVAQLGDAGIGKGIKPESFTDYESHKRSVYLPIVRDCVPEVLDLFDFAEPSLVVAGRDVTNVPSQALYLLNNKFVREQAATFAKRVLGQSGDDSQKIDFAYQAALGRHATAAEIEGAVHYVREVSQAATTPHELAWTTFCQALFACAEFRYLR